MRVAKILALAALTLLSVTPPVEAGPLTDPSVTEVWYHIDDNDPSNNDAATRTQGGNGTGFEPFTDTNSNGTWDVGRQVGESEE